MLKLRFKCNGYNDVILPVYKASINNFDSEYPRFNENSNNVITILENPQDELTWYKQLNPLPTYDEMVDKKRIERVYTWEKNSDVLLRVSFGIYNSSVIGGSNNQNYCIDCYIANTKKNCNTPNFGISYLTPSPCITGYAVTEKGYYCLFYDNLNKCFLSLKTKRNIIKNVQIDIGVTNFGYYGNINIEPQKHNINDVISFKDVSKQFNGQPLYSNVKIFIPDDIGKIIYTNEMNLPTKACDLYNNMFEYLEEEKTVDPNDEDKGSENNPEYDDDNGGDGDHDDTSDNIPEPSLPPLSSTSNGLTTSWKISPSQLEKLAEELWKPDLLEMIHQYFTNPLDCILALNIIPLSPNTTQGVIRLGGYNTGISSNRITNEYINFDMGSINIKRYYGSYLDYSPFTKISCILPYIGEVDINPDEVMNKVLSCSYHVNCVTGECVAYLKSDDNVFATYSGSLSKQVPIAQTDMSAIINSIVQIGATAISTATNSIGINSSNPSNSVNLDGDTINASNNLIPSPNSLMSNVMTAKLQYKHSSQLGSSSGQLAPQFAFLRIERPNLDLPSDYKSFKGYPCNKNLILSSLKGYTEIEASHLSIPSATIIEQAEIKNLLLQGVII